MGALVSFMRIALQVLAGVGVAHLADKVAADKVPTYPAGGVSPFAGSLNIPKILWFLVTMVLGALVAKWIGKKFNIKLLK